MHLFKSTGISSEKEAQVRSLLDKAAKLESDLRSTDPIKQELLQARADCQKLHLHSQDLNQQVRNTSQELQRARGELQQVPALRAEVDNLRAELQRARFYVYPNQVLLDFNFKRTVLSPYTHYHLFRTAFEYEKKANAEQLEQRQAMEKNLVDMARDLEKLRAEVTNAEKMGRFHSGNIISLCSGTSCFVCFIIWCWNLHVLKVSYFSCRRYCDFCDWHLSLL